MGADESKPLFKQCKQAIKSEFLKPEQLEGEVSRFVEQWDIKKLMNERLIEEDPTNSENYLQYTIALMGGGQRELALKHMQIYWDSCNKTFLDLIGIISAAQEGECSDISYKFCKIGRKKLKSGIWKNEDNMKKIRFYIHYANVKMSKGYPFKKVNKSLKKAVYLLNNYPKTYKTEGRIYQMKLQLAANYTVLQRYDKALTQIKPILKYKNKQFFDGIDDKGNFERILVNKTKYVRFMVN